MKKIILNTFVLMLFCNIVIAQVLDGFNYQAVIRGVSGDLVVNQAVNMEVSIIGGISGETVLYTETHNVTTDNYGRVNLAISGGNVQYGDFSQINWSENKMFVNVKIDLGSGYVDMGTMQLLSVPYAMFANSANKASALGSEGVYSTNSDTLFVVKDHSGNVVFAVFPDGAQVIVNEAAKGKVGGFAVSGRSPSKATDIDIVKITADSTRIYVNDTVTAKGKVGGFAVSGRSPSKSSSRDILFVTADSTRIFVNESTGIKSKVGGFAVSGRSPSKGTTYDYLQVTKDSTRVYIVEPLVKGKVGGFAVSGRSPSKGSQPMLITTVDSTRIYTNNTASGFGIRDNSSGTSKSYMQLTPLNYFIGHESGSSITTGLYNSFLGYQAGKNNTIAGDNVFIGYKVGLNNTTGGQNVFVGTEAGENNTTGTHNVFLGHQSGFTNVDGNYNSFMGYASGFSNLSGSNNLFLGYESGYHNTIGNDNMFVGYQCGYTNTSGSVNLFLGYQSGFSNTTGDNNLFVGKYSGYSNTIGASNTFIGSQAGQSNINGTDNLFIGTQSGVENSSGNFNTFLGSSSGAANTTGSHNTFLGYMAGYYNTTGLNNTFLGKYSGYGNEDGFYNIYIGYSAAGGIKSGSRNICIGDQTLYYSTTGVSNTIIGYQSGYNTLGNGNVFLGCYAGYNETGSNTLYIDNSNTASPLIYGEFDNNIVRISGELQVTGNVIANYGSPSDFNLKTNLVELASGLNMIKSLAVYYFNWTDDAKEMYRFEDKKQLGLIAQDVEKVLPEIVFTSKSGYKAIDYSKLTPVLLKAVNEQQTQIEELKSENEELKLKLNEIIELLENK